MKTATAQFTVKFLVTVLCLSSTACVEHRLSVDTKAPPHAQLFANGKVLDKANKIEDSKTIRTSHPLPTELHVDGWYRDNDGHLYRAHQYVQSPRPWWQRFPFDLLTDGLWPQDLSVEAHKQLEFRKVQAVEPRYLDTLAEEHGYGSKTPAKTVSQP